MYCKFFGFSEKPFDVTPNPQFLYLTEGHRETLASLIYGIQERRGFMTVIGEVGTGKTTLLKAALDRLDEKTRVAFIFNTDVTFYQMLAVALYEWGLKKPEEKLSKFDALQRLNNFAIEQIAKGGNVALIVDEAQNLENNVMERLHLLSNLETRRHKLVQIVLSGQPELNTKLGQHELRQLAQRISLRREVFPLDKMDTYAYLQHRLQVAKHKKSSPFTDNARELIWEYSDGVPRKINILCDNALLIAYGIKKNKINSAVVKEAAQDLKWHRFSGTNASSASLDAPPGEITEFNQRSSKPPRRTLRLTAAMIIAGLLIFVGSFLLNESGFQFSKLIGFIRNFKGPAVQSVQPDPTKQQVQVTQSDTNQQAAITKEISAQELPKKDAEPKTRINNDDVLYRTVYRDRLVNEKKSNLIVQDNEAKKMSQITALNENNRSEVQALDKEKSNLSAPDKTEVTIRQIVVKKGDTLYDIIVRTYGKYDKATLSEVLKDNPSINDPRLVHAGQVIRLQANIK